jgi:hypothetical protein
MQRIYEPRDMLEAEMLAGMLASEGIKSHLSGRYLQGGMGELPVAGLLALQVAAEDAERARQLIAAYNSARPLEDDPPADFSGSLLC